MIMRFEDWLHTVIENGTICEKELNNLSAAYSKKQIMDVVLHPDGLYYICEIGERGFRLPYETITKEFNSYINGKYEKVSVGKNGIEFTTSLYCCYSESDELIIDSTMTALLGCNTKLMVQENQAVAIILDTNCDVSIQCPISARCRVTTYGNPKINIIGSTNNVRIIKGKVR